MTAIGSQGIRRWDVPVMHKGGQGLKSSWREKKGVGDSSGEGGRCLG